MDTILSFPGSQVNGGGSGIGNAVARRRDGAGAAAAGGNGSSKMLIMKMTMERGGDFPPFRRFQGFVLYQDYQAKVLRRWSTDYHTRVPVSYFVWGDDSGKFSGVSDNTDYYEILKDLIKD